MNEYSCMYTAPDILVQTQTRWYHSSQKRCLLERRIQYPGVRIEISLRNHECMKDEWVVFCRCFPAPACRRTSDLPSAPAHLLQWPVRGCGRADATATQVWGSRTYDYSFIHSFSCFSSSIYKIASMFFLHARNNLERTWWLWTQH